MPQLITVSKDGSLTSLQFKRGKGLDLRQLGKAEITRSSLIEWDEEKQMWYIRFLNGEMANREFTFWVSRDYDLGDAELPDLVPMDSVRTLPNGDARYLWNEYDDAVKSEIAVIQALRLKGVSV